MLQDVNLLASLLHGCLVALISEIALLPPKAVLVKQATAADAQQPSDLIFTEIVEELAALDDCTLKGLVGLIKASDRRLVFITLRRSRVDAAD